MSRAGTKIVGIYEFNSGHKNLIVVMSIIYWVSFWNESKVVTQGGGGEF